MSQRREAELTRPSAAPSSDQGFGRAAFSGTFAIDASAGGSPGRPVIASTQDGLSHVRAPGLELLFDPRRARMARTDDSLTIVCGQPKSKDAVPLGADTVATSLVRERAFDAWLGGRFSIVHFDLQRRRAIFLTDRFAVLPICYAVSGDRIDFADRADAVPVADRQIDPQAIYDYLYFHVIPAPRTIFRGVSRLEAATQLEFGERGSRPTQWWRPVFAANAAFHRDEAAEEFRDLLRSAVKGSMRSDAVGAYLSGGTDSSTVAGMLGLVSGRPARTYSIGFGAEGYDEIMYARITARHFGTQHHELYVDPNHVAQGIPIIAAGYDQPFGNSSAVPAYFCAKMARDDGVEVLLAGDGGDELFGGNVRYARQKVFEAYCKLPPSLRRLVIEPLLLTPDWPRRLPLLRKASSYVEQARMPMPARTETYNQLHRIGAHSILSAQLLAAVDPEAPARLQEDVYRATQAEALVDRMLAYDWRLTLTDNDLPKVSTTAALASVEVEFPLLDDALVDFSLRLPAEQKVRRLRLRHFFKLSLKGFLPDQVLGKKKHGFGLPIGPWLLSEPPLFAMSKDAIDGLVARRLVRPEFAGELLSAKLSEHAGFYGEIIWVLMMLEQWLRTHEPAYALDS